MDDPKQRIERQLSAASIVFKNTVTVLKAETDDKGEADKLADIIRNIIYGHPKRMLHHESEEARLKEILHEWGQFLVNQPTIVKQYRESVCNNLKQIEEVIKGSTPEIQQQFKQVRQQYEKIKNEHNQELISMAEKEPNKADKSGRTPLYYAVQYGDLKTIEKILQIKGTDPNAKGLIFTRHVISHPQIARLLMRYGASPFQPTHENKVKNKPLSTFEYDCHSESAWFNPKFNIECLLACKDPSAPLYQEAVKHLNVDLIKRMKEDLKKIEWKPLDKEYFDDVLKELGLGDGTESYEDKKALIMKFAEGVLTDLEEAVKKNSFKYKVAHFMDSLLHSHNPTPSSTSSTSESESQKAQKIKHSLDLIKAESNNPSSVDEDGTSDSGRFSER
ncbi:Ankyrin repeat [Legionella steigerwaltii]|uniref:Ankyrin repeat n=1 Tax=Legionella steigerwaltii TaxID=460 RepID=A0A378L707_9GAMM|nr:ankyrin repeat domain-containing protein [Legionella steigerwaltii]KTD80673.1 Ankyrin repeat protein [Legionella steigerwaltii]STY22487.1 Ankyrin repeat [Legionella steigerwaltii]